jgi:hypothetical protein
VGFLHGDSCRKKRAALRIKMEASGDFVEKGSGLNKELPSSFPFTSSLMFEDGSYKLRRGQ